MNKNITKKAIVSLLTFSLATGFVSSNAANAASTKISNQCLTLAQGTHYTLKVTGISGNVNWKSSNKKVATVNQKGKVTAKQTGKAKVTAVSKSRKFTCQITVVKKNTATTTKPILVQSPTCTQKPVATQQPAATQKPAATQQPAATQKPTATQQPVATQKPTATQQPAATQKPTASQQPAATQKPTASQQPAATQKPTATQQPAATQKPSATTTPSVSNVTEESAYQTLNSLRSTYPEGMTLTNSYYYYSPQFGHGYGCYGFAAKLSDTVFGTAKPYQTHTSFDKIKVGDNIRIGNSHSVIVLTKNANYITVVEGNYNSSVHWDRKITSSSLASSGFTVYTRY